MITADYHVHSTYCDGESTLFELVKSAFDNGIKALGFSGHGYTDFDESYCMSKENTVKYSADIDTLKKMYDGKMQIYKGIERDYFGEPCTGVDYVIGSVHYVKKDGEYIPVDNTPDDLDRCIAMFGGKPMDFVKAYYELEARVAEVTGADIIGHFDLVTKFNIESKYFDEASSEYRKVALYALSEVLSKCRIIEMNTGAKNRGYLKRAYPDMFILKKIRELGGSIILSSDSHNEKTLCMGFPESIDILKECGFKSRIVLYNGEFQEIGL